MSESEPNSYLKTNCDYWSQGVYDNPNVETYVFRIYGRIIKYEFGLDGSAQDKILEFGCGSGGSAKFFDDKGFDVFGVDQSEVDILRCKARLPHKASQFKVVSPLCKSDDRWFGSIQFRIVASFQTLYYLSNTDFEARVKSLYDMLVPGGIFVATMMHESSWYFDMSSPYKDGLRFVKFHRTQDEGRPNLTTNDHYINFTRDELDLKDKFKLFEPLHTKGYYDGVYRDDQGSEKHLVFIGRKPPQL